MVRVAGGPKPPPKPAAGRSGDAGMDAVLKDGKVTTAEWTKTVAPKLEKAPLESREVRAFLDVYADGKVTFDKAAAAGASQLLQAHGYDVPSPESGIRLDKRIVVEGNAGAPDLTFEALVQRAGVDPKATVAIAVVDGGFVNHAMLQDNLSKDGKTLKARYGAALGKSFGTRSRDAAAEGAVHGTHVAGIATRGTSRIQASLAAIPLATAAELTASPDAAATPEPTRKAPKKDPLLQALEHVAAGGASVINVSIETFVDEKQGAAFQKLMEKYPQTLFVFGAGNDFFQLGSAPGESMSLVERVKAPNLAVVGASYPDGGPWNKSNWGKDFVQLAARGHYIASADGTDGDGFRTESGTSMAAPNVTNLAAKCRLLCPTLSPAQLITLMAVTSDAHASWAGRVGSGGTVNADRAMTAAAALALMGKGQTADQALRALEVPTADQPRLREALTALGR